MKVSVKHTHKKDAHNHTIRFTSVENFNEFMSFIDICADYKFSCKDSERYKKLIDNIKNNIVNKTSISISEDDFCTLFSLMTHMAVYELPELIVRQEEAKNAQKELKNAAMKAVNSAKELIKLYEKEIYGYSKTFK